MVYYRCTISKFTEGKYLISIHKDGVRYRFYNGSAIDAPDKPNQLPPKQRYKGFQILQFKFQIALEAGWDPTQSKKEKPIYPRNLSADYFDKVYEDKLKENFSVHYYNDLKSYIKRLKEQVSRKITEDTFQKMVDAHPNWNNTSYNNFRRYAAVIEKGLSKYGYQGEWSKKAKRRRKEEVLHKKYSDVNKLMDALASFNPDLHLCALFTYGCLLRPHREVRELCWGDFNADLSQIAISGKRNKGKRNRIIPVPEYIRIHLKGGADELNIFTGKEKPFNPYYFSLLWTRFKYKHPDLVGKGQTLYSLRHTGAIAVYEKTKNIKILQLVMGHADMATSLTYLRGLEVQQLDALDMPML